MKTVLCYGDSNTWGSATFAPEDTRYAPGERWPGVLAAMLGDAWTVIAEGLPGRTTVHADPVEGGFMDGSAYLMPCLRSHRPLDAVVIMLGTNDLKQRFSVPATDIARGIGELLKIVARSEAGLGGTAPKALIVCPPPILAEHGTRPEFDEMFSGGYEKSLRLAPAYQAIAEEYGVPFLNAGAHIQSSAHDGIHLDVEAQATLGRAVAEKMTKLGW